MSDLRTQLQSIYEQHGQLTAPIVLAEARDEDHPLHDRFDWDDAVAGEKWRLQQAHDLITKVKIVYRDEKDHDQQVRAFHAIRKSTGFVYEPAEAIVRDEMLTKILLADMERDWRTLRRRYDQFAEFRNLILRDLDAA